MVLISMIIITINKAFIRVKTTIGFWHGEAKFEFDGRNYTCLVNDLIGISVEDDKVLITFSNFINQHIYYDTD